MVPTCHAPSLRHEEGDSFCFGSVAMPIALVSPVQPGALSQCLCVKEQLAACGITSKLSDATQWEEIQSS